MKQLKQLVVTTTDNKTGKIQLFQICLHEPRFFYIEKLLHRHSKNVDLRDIAKAISDLSELNKYNIYAVPLSTNDPETPVDSRLQHRGYHNDTDPLIIRNKPLKELRVTINHDNTLHFQNMSTFSDGLLTDTQRKELQTRFPELMGYFVDPQTYIILSAIEKDRILFDLKKDIPLIRKQLDEIEAFNP